MQSLYRKEKIPNYQEEKSSQKKESTCQQIQPITQKGNKEGKKTSAKKKIRKLEKRVADLETTVAQYQLKSCVQLSEDIASNVKKNPSFKKLVGGRTLFEQKGEACRRLG